MKEIILQTESVTKRFGGLTALEQVTIDLKKGEVLGLIGPNGAGKTTLFNTIAGAYFPTSGKILFNGIDVTKIPANKRCKMGIARTFQITKPFGSMTVLENVAVSAIYGVNSKKSYLSRETLDKSYEEAEKILDFVKMLNKKDNLANTLNVSERKRLELCRALATKPELLLIDEVIAGLNPSEVGGMMELIREINSLGVSILMIEHVMQAVMGVSNRIVVLNFGKKIAEGTPEQIAENQLVIEAYLGRRRRNIC